MTSIQDRMFLELRNKEIFQNAHQYALEYLENIFDREVYPSEEALEGLSLFDEDLGEVPVSAEDVLAQLNKHGSPATTATAGGRYFGFVTGSAIPVGLAAKMLSTSWDQNAGMYVMSPVSSKLEEVVQRWLIDLFDLPRETVAGFVSGTSTANLCALGAARYRLLHQQGWDLNEQGLYGAPPIRVVAGRDAHSSVMKAISILGLGRGQIEWVNVDDQGRMMVEDMPALDSNTLLVLQAGNVNSGAFDPFGPLCKLAREAGAWVHVDGAFGLWAAATENHRHLTDGVNGATSWSMDGHKTLNTPYDCGICMCVDSEAFGAALHMSGSYIRESSERDGMFYTPEMSRRARIVELWAIMKYLGKGGIDEMISTMVVRAQQFANEISEMEGFTVENEVVFNQVLVRCATDAQTEAVMRKVQELRECWLGGSIWRGKKVMRVSISSWATTSADITRSVKSFGAALSIIGEM